MKGPSIALFLIGAVLLVITMVMVNTADKADASSRDFHSEMGNLEGALGMGRGSISSSATKRDRTMSYVVGGFGGAAILAGILSLSMGTNTRTEE